MSLINWKPFLPFRKVLARASPSLESLCGPKTDGGDRFVNQLQAMDSFPGVHSLLAHGVAAASLKACGPGHCLHGSSFCLVVVTVCQYSLLTSVTLSF